MVKKLSKEEIDNLSSINVDEIVKDVEEIIFKHKKEADEAFSKLSLSFPKKRKPKTKKKCNFSHLRKTVRTF